ncbi:MAG: DUF3794 domain-containing protein [Clostridia bacterium]|nr:DUF3794 domain-containing protein [Clostridia bacterium]
MDSKKIKTQLFQNETIFQESTEQPIDADFTLPDYCASISRILKCRAVSRIASKGMNGRNITVDGNVTVTLLYADDENKIYGYEYQYPFNKSFEMPVDGEGGTLICKSRCEYLNCRAVTGRKVDLHGAVSLSVCVSKRKSNELLSDFDDDGVELRRGTVPTTVPMGSAEKYLMMEEEIELGQGQPPVHNLLRYESRVLLREKKLLHDKAVIKGDLLLTILYCSENGNLQTVKSILPFSQIVELNGVEEGCLCDASAECAGLELKPRQSVSGEIRSFSLTAKLLICVQAYCDSDMAVVLDSFSRRYETEMLKKEFRFEKLCKTITENFHAKQSFSFAKGELGSVADLWSDVQVGFVGMEENNFTVKGTVPIGMICYSTDGVPAFFERTVDFEYRCPMEHAIIGMMCEPIVEVQNIAYAIIGEDTMEIRLELSLIACIYETNKMSVIADITPDEKKPIQKPNKGALIVYYAAAGESLWDIAQKYGAGIHEMKTLNHCDDLPFSEDKTVLIPMD